MLRTNKWKLGGAFLSTSMITLMLAPPNYFNQPSLLSQYLGYLRSSTPIILIGAGGLYILDRQRAQRLKDRLRTYVRVECIEKYNSIPLSVFLNITDEELNEFLDLYHLADIGIESYFGLIKFLGD